MRLPTVPPPRLPRVAKTTAVALPSGMEVLAARRTGVPMVELRLLIPLIARTRGEAATRSLLARTLMSGTEARSEAAVADAVADLGASLGVSANADMITFTGAVPAPNLEPYLRLAHEIVTGAAFPPSPVRSERRRLADELTIAHAQPERIAAAATATAAFGRHPYGWGLPAPTAVSRVSRTRLHALWQRATPQDAHLILVGDITTTRAAELGATVFSSWRGSAPDTAAPVKAAHSGTATIIDRPGAVQSNIRLIAFAPERSAEDYAACELANLAFGGYFASRYVANIREDKGYSYSPRSLLDHRRATSTLTVAADVATDVTGPALAETWYEMSRAAVGGFSIAEVGAAVAYRLGTTSIATQSQAGLATFLAAVRPHGLGIDYLRSHAARLSAVAAAAADAAASTWLAPRRFRVVIVGDAERIGNAVAAQWPIAVAT